MDSPLSDGFVDNETFVLGLAAVFFGLTVFSIVAGLAVHPMISLFAVPFGGVGFLMWYHASGKLEARVRARSGEGGSRRARRRDRRRRARSSRRGRTRRGSRERGSAGGRSPPADDGPTPREAYRTLGLLPGASDEEIQDAYREKAKAYHPDSDDGDEETFKEINRAYERLSE